MIKFQKFFLFLGLCLLVIGPVSAYDFTLSVYGNANMDDIIDEEDITYLKGIISGVKEKTQFADANYDGIVNEDDISRIESIIAGDETEVTMVDCNERTVTMKVPLKRVVAAYPGAVTLITTLDSFDTIVGVDENTIQNADSQLFGQKYPEIKNLETVGTFSDINQEKILSLHPDVVISMSSSLEPDVADEIQKNTGVPVFFPNFNRVKYDDDGGYFENWRQTGILFGKQNRAEDLISLWNEEIGKVEDITSSIPEDDKVKVYIAGFTKAGFEGTLCLYDPIDIAGGKNVAEGAAPTTNFGVLTISKEQIIKWNPDVILIHRAGKEPWYPIEDIVSDPELG
ncbi:ABC transporter substrate-binding protein [Methanospirillum stamsii]|uniref:Fe/B12 periplasmic-binding domain-containing protein n=1 Tax=Methanospirillum stamsii TaxID=1277351 RepID=A0A2V2N2I3_9EURY|nr:ABC transporter substrate-binding protein [Methanospirillum stamsii]PWR69671.1 hypothetical protein DLD82_17090 [Methanospirillum stamsii]